MSLCVWRNSVLIILTSCVFFLQSTTRVKPFICTMPMRLDEGWNQIQFNLSDFTRRAYGEQHTSDTPLTRWNRLFPCGHVVSPFPNKLGTNSTTCVQVPTTLKRCACKYMRTAASGASIFLIACIPRKSYPRSLNFSFPFRYEVEKSLRTITREERFFSPFQLFLIL